MKTNFALVVLSIISLGCADMGSNDPFQQSTDKVQGATPPDEHPGQTVEDEDNGVTDPDGDPGINWDGGRTTDAGLDETDNGATDPTNRPQQGRPEQTRDENTNGVTDEPVASEEIPDPEEPMAAEEVVPGPPVNAVAKNYMRVDYTVVTPWVIHDIHHQVYCTGDYFTGFDYSNDYGGWLITKTDGLIWDVVNPSWYTKCMYKVTLSDGKGATVTSPDTGKLKISFAKHVGFGAVYAGIRTICRQADGTYVWNPNDVMDYTETCTE